MHNRQGFSEQVSDEEIKDRGQDWLTLADRPLLETWGMQWPQSRDEQEWLAFLNELVEVGSLPADDPEMDTRRRETIQGARECFFDLLPGFVLLRRQLSQEESDFVTPWMLVGAARLLAECGIDDKLAKRFAAIAWADRTVEVWPTDFCIVGNWTAFRELMLATPEFDIHAQDALIEVVAQGIRAEDVSAEDRTPEMEIRRLLACKARQELAASFAGRVANIARWNFVYPMTRLGKQLEEDMFQAGMLTLIKSIGGYALHPPEERHAFWPYAQLAIGGTIGGVARAALLRNSLPNERLANHLGRYLEAQRKLERVDRRPSNDEIAAVMGMERNDVAALRMWGTSLVDLEDIDLDTFTGRIFPQVRENLRAVVLIERALEFLGEMQRDMICMRYGLDGSEQLGVGEIAQRLGVWESSISEAHRRDLQVLQPIIIGLQQDTLDYEELRVKSSIRNVLSLLHFLGVPAPDEARLPELRELARMHLKQIVRNEREEQAMCKLYQLDGSPRLKHNDIGKIFGVTGTMIRHIERRVLERLKTGRRVAQAQAPFDSEPEAPERVTSPPVL